MTTPRRSDASHAAIALALLVTAGLLAGCVSPGGGAVASSCPPAAAPPGSLESSPTLSPDERYVYGAGHPHADFRVFFGGVAHDFAQRKYMVSTTQDRSIHLEGSEVHPPAEWGDVLHLHDSNVTITYFLGTLDWTVNEGRAGERAYLLTDEDAYYSDFAGCLLRVFVEPDGGEWTQTTFQHVITPGDRILVTYGSEDAEALAFQQAAVTMKGRSGEV